MIKIDMPAGLYPEDATLFAELLSSGDAATWTESFMNALSLQHDASVADVQSWFVAALLAGGAQRAEIPAPETPPGPVLGQLRNRLYHGRDCASHLTDDPCDCGSEAALQAFVADMLAMLPSSHRPIPIPIRVITSEQAETEYGWSVGHGDVRASTQSARTPRNPDKTS